MEKCSNKDKPWVSHWEKWSFKHRFTSVISDFSLPRVFFSAFFLSDVDVARWMSTVWFSSTLIFIKRDKTIEHIYSISHTNRNSSSRATTKNTMQSGINISKCMREFNYSDTQNRKKNTKIFKQMKPTKKKLCSIHMTKSPMNGSSCPYKWVETQFFSCGIYFSFFSLALSNI